MPIKRQALLIINNINYEKIVSIALFSHQRFHVVQWLNLFPKHVRNQVHLVACKEGVTVCKTKIVKKMWSIKEYWITGQKLASIVLFDLLQFSANNRTDWQSQA